MIRRGVENDLSAVLLFTGNVANIFKFHKLRLAVKYSNSFGIFHTTIRIRPTYYRSALIIVLFEIEYKIVNKIKRKSRYLNKFGTYPIKTRMIIHLLQVVKKKLTQRVLIFFVYLERSSFITE